MPPRTRRLRATYLALARNPVADDAADAGVGVEVAKPKVLRDALGVPMADMHSPEYAWTKKIRGKIWEDHDGDLEAANDAASAGGSPFSGAGFQTCVFSRPGVCTSCRPRGTPFRLHI